LPARSRAPAQAAEPACVSRCSQHVIPPVFLPASIHLERFVAVISTMTRSPQSAGSKNDRDDRKRERGRREQKWNGHYFGSLRANGFRQEHRSEFFRALHRIGAPLRKL